jgi:NADH:ubiquinone oxidoreductase subunit 3 (subunit A)
LTPNFNLSTLFCERYLHHPDFAYKEEKMPSGWDVYYVICLSAVLALAIPVSLRFVSWLASRSRPASLPPSTESASKGQVEGDIGRRTNTRFFAGANVSLLLIAFALILIPCAAAFKSEADGSAGQMLCIVSICILAGLGLLYAARKGDLRWLSGFRNADTNEREHKERE